MRRIIALAALIVAGCSNEPTPRIEVAGGDPKAGKLLLEQYSCGTCHEIPGVATAVGRTGPALTSFAQHVYVAGKFPNTPEWLVRWIQDPPALSPQTAMPDLDVSEANARHMAAYLYGLH